MRRRSWGPWPATVRILSAGALLSGGVAAGAQQLNVSRMALPNGLVVLALEDHAVPSIALETVFRVGSRNERPGITGISHLFEHMMFNGSAHYKPKVFDQLIESGGGYSNASTSEDITEYHEEFSTATLDTVLRLEADRMRALKLDKQNIEQERSIVKEERRVNYDNSVEGAMYEALWNSAFVAHPYRWLTIGFMTDINAIRLEDAKAYFRTYYAPDNAVMAAVGDFRTADLFTRIRRYFGDIPRQAPPRGVVRDEPPQHGERRIALYRAAELPAVQIAYHIGSMKSPDDPALDVLSNVLAQGESSRLYRDMVYEKQIATSISAENDSRMDPGLFTFYAQARPGHSADECEAAIYRVLDGVKQDGITERELQKARNQLRSGYLNGFKTNVGRAGLLATYEAEWGTWKALLEYLLKHDRVTAADVRRVARTYFDSRNRTVVTLHPEAAEAPRTGARGGTE